MFYLACKLCRCDVYDEKKFQTIRMTLELHVGYYGNYVNFIGFLYNHEDENYDRGYEN